MVVLSTSSVSLSLNACMRMFATFFDPGNLPEEALEDRNFFALHAYLLNPVNPFLCVMLLVYSCLHVFYWGHPPRVGRAGFNKCYSLYGDKDKVFSKVIATFVSV